MVKVLAGVSILVLLVVAAGLLAHFLVSPDKPSKSVSPVKSVPPTPQTSAKSPTFEIYPSKKIPSVKKPVKSTTPATNRPLVAIIIDDLGYDKKIAIKFSKLNAVLTFSILPHSPFQKTIAHL